MAKVSVAKALFDANVILDFLLERGPFVEDAAQLFRAIENGQLEGHVAAITLNNLFYIIRKLRGQEIAYDAVKRILVAMQICPVTQQTLAQSFQLGFKDFEDAIQTICALEQDLACIVTRNPQDFSSSAITVLSPQELIALLESNSAAE